MMSFLLDDDQNEVAIFSKSKPLAMPSPIEADALVAEQMSRLSMKDRERVYYDIYGLLNEPKEDEDTLISSLKKLQIELDLIKVKKAYDMAHSMDPCYVEDKDFRLMFLRADRFNAKAAALRMARHFDIKMELFGHDTLARDIVQDDLDEEAIASLYCGTTQCLPKRDRAGRLVMVHFATAQETSFNELSRLRRNFYSVMLEARHEETQKKGVVAVDVLFNPGGDNEKECIWKALQVMKGLPIRVEAIHFCYSSLVFWPIFVLFRLAMSLFLRLRVRAHYGNATEFMQALGTFGIPIDVFPVTDEGEIKNDAIKEILDKRKLEERSSTTVAGVSVPGRLDVLFGRGRGSQEHIGNIRFRVLVEECKAKYDKASKEEKTRLSEEIVSIVKQAGGRFLKEDKELSWVVVDDLSARGKVSQLFRAFRVSSDFENTSSGHKSDRSDDGDDVLPPGKRFRAP